MKRDSPIVAVASEEGCMVRHGVAVARLSRVSQVASAYGRAPRSGPDQVYGRPGRVARGAGKELCR
jgi:hypothetical protein